MFHFRKRHNSRVTFLLATTAAFLLVLGALILASGAFSRARENNSEYADRRARLRSKVDGPVVLFGFTGRENSSPSYIFGQEENFYYLSGHNQPGAALLIIPDPPVGKSWDGSREVFFLPARNLTREKWDSIRIGPADPDVAERTGFATVEPFNNLKGYLEKLSKIYPGFYTLLPGNQSSGYPHAQNWVNWLYQTLPQNSLRDAAPLLAAMRPVKSASELALMQHAVDVSVDAHLAAMRLMRPGIFEYQVAARMEFVHKDGGCQGEAYSPIVGAGFFSTVLHYNEVSRKIEPGDIVVLDVGAECDGYAADITRTLPANGAFTARQREIYDIVLGAQNAALAALKPGMTMGGQSEKSLNKIAMDYINNSAGRDKQGNPLGKYFIHGLGHHVGLNVHDANDNRPLEPGMVVTIEPGIYIPEENLGVRIEDMALVTETGYKLLTARLPRTAPEVEKIMAAAKSARASGKSTDADGRNELR